MRVEYTYTDEDAGIDYDLTLDLDYESIRGRCEDVEVRSVTIERVLVYAGTRYGVELDRSDDNWPKFVREKAIDLRSYLDACAHDELCALVDEALEADRIAHEEG